MHSLLVTLKCIILITAMMLTHWWYNSMATHIMQKITVKVYM